MSIQSELDRINGAKSDIITSIEGKGVNVPEGAKIDDLATYVNAIVPASDIPAAGTSLGLVKSGGDVTISNGVITVNDLTSKYATPTYVDGKFEALEDAIPTKTSQLTNNSGFATETYVNNKVAGIVDSSPEALDTLNELAAALGDNPNFSTDVLNLIGQKASQADLDDLSVDVENLTTEVGKKANASSLHKVATSGSYNDLTNKPTIPTKTSQLTNDSSYASTAGNNTFTGSNVFMNNRFAVKATASTDDSWINLTNSSNGAYYAFGIRRPYANYGLQMKYHPDASNQDTSRPGDANGTADIYYDIYHQGNYWRMPTATTSVSGLMSAADKTKVNGLASVATSGSYNDLTNKPTIPTAVTVDSALSSTSTNPVQNKAIYAALGGKADNADIDQLHQMYNDTYTELGKKANDADLKTVAKTGSYNDLTNKPTIPAAVTVDSSLSSTSTNPVQNKVIKTALDGKQPSGSYVTTNNTGVQSIEGGLVVGGTTATATGKGRIMLTGSTNPLIGLQAIDASGTQLTPYYFQVSNDVMYIGPTSSKALAFDSNGNTSIPAALTVSGDITENGSKLSSKYVTNTKLEEVLGSYVNDIDALLGG